MKLTNEVQSQSTVLSLYYKEPFINKKIGDFIYQSLPSKITDLIIVCIGSDRSTGDALGPITGSMLAKRKHSNFSVYGTLEYPIHALNLNDELKNIKRKHPNGYIIAIDACLGRTSSIGFITASIGALKPGLALKKKLPEVGNFNITGIVNARSTIDFITLQNTRLHTVVEQAEVITRALAYVEYLYFKKKTVTL